MNEVYAANPSVIGSSADLRFLLSKFGPYAGRYLLKYPSFWHEQVLSDGLSDLEQERIKALLRRAQEDLRFVARASAPWHETHTWDENITKLLIEGAALHQVISHRAPSTSFIRYDDFDPAPTAEEQVLGTATEYARVSKTLLSFSPELHFIDPYINLEKEEYYEPLKAMISVAARGKCQALYIWARQKNLITQANQNTFLTAQQGALSRLKREAKCKDGTLVKMYLLEDESSEHKLHARYLLSIKGGIRFDQGFQILRQSRTADISPIGQDLHHSLLERYKEAFMSKLIKEQLTA